MKKDMIETQINNTTMLLEETNKKVNGNNGWYQNTYIRQTLSELELVEQQLHGIIKAIRTEFNLR